MPGGRDRTGSPGAPGDVVPGRPRWGPWRLTLCVLLAAACGGDSAGGEGGASARPGPGAGSAVSGPEEFPVTRYRGLFSAENGWTFTPCGDVEIPAEGPAIPDLLEIYEELVPETAPRQVLFVDALAQLRDDGRRVRVDLLEVRRAWHEGTGCDDDETGILLEASGTEPFWNVRVEESVLVWQTPEALRRFRHGGLEQSETGSFVVRGTEEEGDASIAIEAWPEPCRNQMSGAFSHLQAEITLEGRTVAGCAYLGMQVEAAE